MDFDDIKDFLSDHWLLLIWLLICLICLIFFFSALRESVLEEKNAIIRGKRTQFLIGLFFLIPGVLGIVAFILCLFGINTDFATLSDLSSEWTALYGFSKEGGGGGGGMSAAPIFIALISFVGAYLIKDSIEYMWLTDKDMENSSANENNNSR